MFIINQFAVNFIPHGHCYLWKPDLLWLHIISDSAIALAYAMIPFTLVYIVKKRHDLPFDWMVFLFGSFIVSCGITHVMNIWTLWHPDYWLSGCFKAICAGVSLATAIILIPLTPKILAIPSQSQLQAANLALQTEIIERERAQSELETAKEVAESANRAKSEFLANMSHEIRTPMNAILGFSEILYRKVAEPQQRQYLHSIISSGKTLLALINDILDLSKIEAGKLTLEAQPVNLRDLVIEIQQIFNEDAHQKNLLIIVAISQTFPELILFDPLRIRQVLFNVVGNAIKFTEQGRIKVSLDARSSETSSGASHFGIQEERGKRKEENSLCTSSEMLPTSSTANYISLEIQIADTGIGIAPEQQERIFESFVQSDGQSTRKYGGTGLGLAITKRLTDLLGGTITLTSELGKGSTFMFNFPQVQVLETVDDFTDTGRSDEDLNQFQPATILVVDDVESNLKLVAGYFAETQHRLLFARDGLEAIEQVAANSLDLILLDLWMPNMNGFEVAQYLKETPATQEIPIICVTASSREQDENLVKKIAQGFIRKPFSCSQLVLALKKVLPVQPNSSLVAETATDGVAEVTVFNPTAEIVAKLPELLEKLAQEQEEVWPELSRTQIQGELKDFVSRLRGWAEEYQCQILWDYAVAFDRQLEEFDWHRIPLTLAAFPQVIQDISNQLAK